MDNKSVIDKIVDSYTQTIAAANLPTIGISSTVIQAEKVMTVCDIYRCPSVQKASHSIHRQGNSAHNRISLCPTCLNTMVLTLPEEFMPAMLSNPHVKAKFNEIIDIIDSTVGTDKDATEQIASLQEQIEQLKSENAKQLASMQKLEKEKGTIQKKLEAMNKKQAQADGGK